MTWIATTVDRLAAMSGWGYRDGAEPATEPTAWVALALHAHGRVEAADRARRWLVEAQGKDGSLGISLKQHDPHWPTGPAVLAWTGKILDHKNRLVDNPFATNIQSATRWMLTVEGKPAPLEPDVIGHDTTLVGWPWVESTHTWLEPTAMYLLALKAVGDRNHNRARDAVRVLLDRQLPDGGCNYGNTFVLKQELRPQLAPSGLALLALAGERDETGRIDKTLEYVQRQAVPEATTLSLAWGVIGLAAHGKFPLDAAAWLGKALERSERRAPSAQAAALALMATLGEKCPLIGLTTEASPA